MESAVSSGIFQHLEPPEFWRAEHFGLFDQWRGGGFGRSPFEYDYHCAAGSVRIKADVLRAPLGKGCEFPPPLLSGPSRWGLLFAAGSNKIPSSWSSGAILS